MKTHLFLVPALLVSGLAIHAADPKSDTAVDSKAAFARLKTLAGEWEANTSMGKMHLSLEVIAGGTALVQRDSGENMPVMLTVYHLDNGRLMLTHYCMAGNQPRMVARAFDASTGDLKFDFLDGTNLTPASGHMHDASFHIADNDHFSDNWDFYENGQKKMAEGAQWVRVR